MVDILLLLIFVIFLVYFEDDPSFSISRDPGFGYPLTEGMRVSLRCEVDANPPSMPQWVRDDGPITVPQDEAGFLNFSSIEGQHSGWYRCTTHHEFGFFASFGYFLNVRSKFICSFIYLLNYSALRAHVERKFK